MGILFFFLLFVSQNCFAHQTPETTEQLTELIDKLILLVNAKPVNKNVSTVHNDGIKETAKPSNESNVIYLKMAQNESDNLNSETNGVSDIGDIGNFVLGKSTVNENPIKKQENYFNHKNDAWINDGEINGEDKLDVPLESRRMMSKSGKMDLNANIVKSLTDLTHERSADINAIPNTLRSGVSLIPNPKQTHTIGLNNADQDFRELYTEVEKLLKEVSAGKVSGRQGAPADLMDSAPFDIRTAEPFPLMGTVEPQMSPRAGYNQMYRRKACGNCRHIPYTLPLVLRQMLQNQHTIRSLQQTKILADNIKKIRAIIALKNLKPYL